MLRSLVKISDALLYIGIELRGVILRTVCEAFGGLLRLIVSVGAAIEKRLSAR